MRPICVRLLAAVPILALVGGLPLVNRAEPLVFGLPLLLFWMLAWVMATPAFLGLAYALQMKEAEAERRGNARGQVKSRTLDAGRSTQHTKGGGPHNEGGGR